MTLSVAVNVPFNSCGAHGLGRTNTLPSPIEWFHVVALQWQCKSSTRIIL